jgi:hypothetical protein
MARRSLPSARSQTDPPLRLVDVDIVAEAEDASASTRIDGDDVAALLDVTTETNRLLNPEDISLELEHVADLLAALADDAAPPTSGALTVAEHCLRRLAARVDALRPGARTRAHRFVITPGVREMLKAYTSAKEPLAQEFLGQLVAVIPVPGSSPANGDNDHDDLSWLHAIDDPIPLADRAHTAEAGELADERLALLFG